MTDLSSQNDEPPINKAIEDILAIAGGDDAEEAMLLDMTMTICAEKLARVGGRQHCRDVLQRLDRFIRDAQPVRPWKP